jgi:hypothetical protein
MSSFPSFPVGTSSFSCAASGVALSSSPAVRVSLDVPAGSELSSIAWDSHPDAAAVAASATALNNAVLMMSSPPHRTPNDEQRASLLLSL